MPQNIKLIENKYETLHQILIKDFIMYSRRSWINGRKQARKPRSYARRNSDQ